MTEFQTERQIATAIIGTTTSTLLGPVPPQMKVNIYSLRYANPTGGTVVAYLAQAQILPGYTNESATLLDGVAVPPGSTEYNDNSDSVITNVSPGNSLIAYTTSGSLFVRVTYEYRYGRN